MSEKWAPDIFEYLDYRRFLADYYAAAKENKRAFSYRYFSRKAGYSSPNFLKLVMDGQRNISQDSIERFADALKLNKSETRFFASLVAFNQADNEEEKNEAFEHVAASRRFRTARKLDRDFFLYLSRWYYPAIREMVARADFVEEPDWIAGQLIPPIQPKQASECIEILLDLGLLVRDDNGKLRRGDASITTGHEVRSLAIGNYHRQMLQRAAESIELVPSERRDISGLTVSVSLDTVSELKARIQEFRELLLDRCDRDEEPDSVYQINFQLFPLTEANAVGSGDSE
ncbi:MAG: TIGR02147 family protein [Myxococcales bacterium]|nr:TIGR02147 family protein [Myxococcales bacterium]